MEQVNRGPTYTKIRSSNVFLVLLLPLWLGACSAGGGSDGYSISGTSTSPATGSTGSTGSTGTDATAPAVTITAPTTGSTYTATSANITLAGSASDNVALSQISWSNSLGGSGSSTPSGTTANWSFAITLRNGANVITVVARDTSGNTAQRKLTVNYAATTSNTATLTWNGVTAANLSGYRIYYGTSPGTYLQSYGQGISVGTATTYTIMGLSSGTRYYFVVTAQDTSSNESGYSNEVYKDVP